MTTVLIVIVGLVLLVGTFLLGYTYGETAAFKAFMAIQEDLFRRCTVQPRQEDTHDNDR